MTKGWRRGKLRTKVVAGVLAIVIAVLAVFDFTAVTALRRYLITQTDANLNSALQKTQPILPELLPRSDKTRVRAAVPVPGQYSIEFVTAQGKVVDLQGGLAFAPPPGQPVASVAQAKAKTVTNADGQVPYRVSSVSVPGLAGTLVAGINLGDVDATLAQLRVIIIIGSGAAAALIFVGVSLVMRRGLRPIEMMAARADRITAGDLTDRVGPADAGSEVGRLGAERDARPHRGVRHRTRGRPGADAALLRRGQP